MRNVDASAGQQVRLPLPRQSARILLDAEVALRRPGLHNYRVNVHDISCHGCRLEFVERPKADERIWVKFDGLEPIEALVCWNNGFMTGVAFERPIHPAVFDLLVSRLKSAA